MPKNTKAGASTKPAKKYNALLFRFFNCIEVGNKITIKTRIQNSNTPKVSIRSAKNGPKKSTEYAHKAPNTNPMKKSAYLRSMPIRGTNPYFKVF